MKKVLLACCIAYSIACSITKTDSSELIINNVVFTGTKNMLLRSLKEYNNIIAPDNILVVREIRYVRSSIVMNGQSIYFQEKRAVPWKRLEFFPSYGIGDSFPRIVSIIRPKVDSLVVYYWITKDLLITKSFTHAFQRWTPQ